MERNSINNVEHKNDNTKFNRGHLVLTDIEENIIICESREHNN
jgi:hypothetical protein